MGYTSSPRIFTKITKFCRREGIVIVMYIDE